MNTTFRELLDEYHIPYQTEGQHCRPGWIQMDCPQCEGPLYLGYNLAGRYCNCWRCGPMSTYQFLKLRTGKDGRDINHQLRNIEVERTFAMPTKVGKLKIPSNVSAMGLAHRRYLESRGFDPDEIARLWGVCGIGISQRLGWRLFIPFHLHSEVVSWTTRSISDEVPSRYISAKLEEESVPHKKILYGSDFVRHGCVVCEGPLDVWKIGPGAVATCGIGFNNDQLLRLSRYPLIGVCFDREPAAQQRARELATSLAALGSRVCNVVLDSKDPGSASKQEIEHIRKEFLE